MSSFLACCPAWPGLLYVVLCAFQVPLAGGVLVQDLVAPLLLLQLALRYRAELFRLLEEEGRLLVLFLLLAFASSLIHVFMRSGSFYDFCVFSYMAVLYAYFRIVPVSPRQQACLGGGLLFFFWVLWAGGSLLPPELKKTLFYLDSNYDHEGVRFLTCRFSGTFGNPNLLGAFFPLPLLLLSGWWKKTYASGRTVRKLALLAGAFLVCLPLFSTVSKHFIMSFAVVLGSWLPLLELRGRRCRFLTGAGALLLAGAVCWCTVLVLTVPLKKNFPWINADCQSNYSLHQEIYLRMIGHDLPGALVGRGARELHRLYPQYADRGKIEDVLSRYHGEKVVEAYVTFMDPHNEYLNIASFFGLPALAAMLAFWFSLFGRARRRGDFLLFYFAGALMICCLWDDLLSKRYIWIELALAVTAMEGPAAKREKRRG